MRHIQALRPTDKELLLSLLLEAVVTVEDHLGRMPTKLEILDHLFSDRRDDAEAIDLAWRLDEMLDALLDEWEAMNCFSFFEG
jgi:hypothetical protein